jgi:hypothetical protein
LDGQTDMTKLLVAVDHFVNSPIQDLIVEREAHVPIALDLFCVKSLTFNSINSPDVPSKLHIVGTNKNVGS